MQRRLTQGVPGTCLVIKLVDGGLAVDDLAVIRKEEEEEEEVIGAVEEVMMVAAVVEEVTVEEVLMLLEKNLHPLAQRTLATTCKGLLKIN